MKAVVADGFSGVPALRAVLLWPCSVGARIQSSARHRALKLLAQTLMGIRC